MIISAAACRGTPDLEDGKAAEADENYSQAYQIYAAILAKGSEKFEKPALPDRVRSSTDLGNWFGDLLSDYLFYRMEKPRKQECQEAHSRLMKVRRELEYVENHLEPVRCTPLTEERYVDLFKHLCCRDQRGVPASVREAAASAHKESLSIVHIEGDTSSHVDGVLYSPALNVGIPFAIRSDSAGSSLLVITGGTWTAVARVDLYRSDPRNKIYYEYRDIRGRYAATLLKIPESSHVCTFRFRVRDNVAQNRSGALRQRSSGPT